MLVIKAKHKAKGNKYEVNGSIAYLEVYKKNGSTTKTMIDADDLPMVLEKGTWFAQWHKDFNNYLVLTFGENSKETLQAFLLKVPTKAPVRHINGDTLDNRRCNLELYEQNKTNDFQEFDSKAVTLILRDKYGNEKGKTIIDKEDLDRVINTGYCWVNHKVNGESYAVANTPEGRIFLNRFILQSTENEVTHAINLNTLDNRKSNLESIKLNEEATKE